MFWCLCACVQAKDMVSLVNKFAAKVEEKKGALSEDEVSDHSTVVLVVVYEHTCPSHRPYSSRRIY